MKLTPIRSIDVIAASRRFKAIFGEDKGFALAAAMSTIQADPESAPQVIANLERAGFTRPQAEEVVRQTIIGVTGKIPPSELLARRVILPQSAAEPA